jgi:S-adenosylmethionine-dependent methyltransferase
MTASDKFDHHLNEWLESLELPWNKLRYRLFQANLQRHLPENQPLKILDAGGGNGQEAIPLAQAGHDVTLVDSSRELLTVARRIADQQGITT